MKREREIVLDSMGQRGRETDPQLYRGKKEKVRDEKREREKRGLNKMNPKEPFS